MNIDKNLTNLKVFMIGIGGISMSGLAKILHNRGVKVAGSDMNSSYITDNLKKIGINVYSKHQRNNIDETYNLIVYSGAIHSDNPEILKGKELGIKLMERSEFLGYISKRYQNVIAISGTHGKTTTTAMIGEIFVAAGFNPTIHIGGESMNLSSNTIIGGDEYFIVEACEYRNSFKYLRPHCSVITNIDCDHLDYYKDINAIKKAFNKFALNSQHIIDINDYDVKNLIFDKNSYVYDVFYKNKFFINIKLNMLGMHNVSNSIFAIAVAHYYGIDKEIIAKSLSNFNGVKRRYEKITEIDDVPIIIDYAHHPTEIKNSIAGIKCVYDKILVIFQPHTYSRTLMLFDQFVETLNNQNLILYKTYAAREKEIVGGRAEDLYTAINSTCTMCYEIGEVIDEIKSKIMLYDCVLVLGAGDLADKLKTMLKNIQ